MNTGKLISTRIKSARLAKGWSQKKLAEEANLTDRTISNVECGKGINFGTLVSIAEALDYHLMELLR